MKIWETEHYICELIKACQIEDVFYLIRNKPWLASYAELIKRFWKQECINFFSKHRHKPALLRRCYRTQRQVLFPHLACSILKCYTSWSFALEVRRRLIENTGKFFRLPHDRIQISI